MYMFIFVQQYLVWPFQTDKKHTSNYLVFRVNQSNGLIEWRSFGKHSYDPLELCYIVQSMYQI